MIKGGNDTVVVVVTVVTVCCVAGPKLSWASVECCGGRVCCVLVLDVADVSPSWDWVGLRGGMLSVGDAGAVDSTASGLNGASARKPKP